jgi:hypothetical protein
MMKKSLIALVIAGSMFATGCSLLGASQSGNDDRQSKEQKDKTSQNEEGKDKDEKDKKGKIKSIEEVTESCRKIDGLFTLYQDTAKGDLYLQIEKDKLGDEFIYFGYAENGVPSLQLFRGAYRADMVFKIERYFDRLEFIVPNNNFYYNPESALSRASDANISDAVIFSGDIKGMSSKQDTMLIEANELFMKETLAQIEPPQSRNNRVYKVGRLTNDMTKIKDIRNYPENTNVMVEYVFLNKSPKVSAGPVLAHDKSVSFKFQHTFLRVPENDYEKRKADPRVGYFSSKQNDMTTTDVTPYRDFIHRWNLKKKNPEAELSEPVEPIVYWMENTTPHHLRDAVREGILNWNKAFRKIGFKNAIVVKQQPKDADWEAGDIRYNVVRWTSSPTPAFGGYGPRFYNPKTGQIMGADVMLEYTQFQRRVSYKTLYQDNTTSHELYSKEQPDPLTQGEMMSQNLAFGSTLADTQYEMEGMLHDAIVSLVTHEVGHTLGLTHNFKGSYYLSPDELNDTTITSEKGLTASIMDYTIINVAKNPEEQGDYFSTTIGPYDYWAIEYGYKGVNEEKELENIAAKSTEEGHQFANDAEVMRSYARGIDPRVMTYDLTNDPIQYSIDRMKLVDSLIRELPEKYMGEGRSYHEMRYAFSVLINQYKYAVRTISRYIGGVYTERHLVGQDAEMPPFTPVPEETQKEAMEAITQYVLSPDAFDFPKELLQHLQYQRRGFNVGNDAPPVHRIVEILQKEALRPMMYYVMMERILDSEHYGNDYELDEYIRDMTNAIFKQDNNEEVNSFRQYLQVLYTKQLGNMSGPSSMFAPNRYPYQARSLAVGEMNHIKELLDYNGHDAATQAHQDYLRAIIETAFRHMQ